MNSAELPAFNLAEDHQQVLLDQLCELEKNLAPRRFCTLSLGDLHTLLEKSRQLQQQAEHNLADSSSRNARLLLTAIFKLSADLSEKISGHLVDKVQDKEHSIDFLQKELSQKLRDRHQAMRLLTNNQNLRIQTQNFSDAFALGAML